MESFTVFLSNRVECLFDQWKNRLFHANEEPFVRRMVVIPNLLMKSWMTIRLGGEIGISTGIEFLFLQQTIERLGTLISNPVFRIPSAFELSFVIETEIRSILQNTPTPIWEPMIRYLSKQPEKRLPALSDQLASLFVQYGIYGAKMWKFENHWQQALWDKIFSNGDLTFPSRQISSWMENQLQKDTCLQVHIFGINYMPPLIQKFFLHLSKTIPVSIYVISPCAAFWSDIQSDRDSHQLLHFFEKKKIPETQQVALEEYLRDRNPLLANWGSIGRHMAQQIEESPGEVHECYRLSRSVETHPSYTDYIQPDICFEPNETTLTMLEAIQSDIALLISPEKRSSVSFDRYDRSLQVHVAPSPQREIEILYNAILRIIDSHSQEDSPICPKDIFVLAPDIASYAPYIRMVFEKKESLLTAQILDAPTATQNHIVQAFLGLILLPSTRWDASSLHRLLEFPSIHRKCAFSREEVSTIREWIQTTGIRWGENAAHRRELLQKDIGIQIKDEFSSVGTWEQSLERLLMGLTTTTAGQEEIVSSFPIIPLECVDTSDTLLLGNWIRWLRSLRQNLRPIYDGTTMTLSSWESYFHGLVDQYLAVERDDTSDESNAQLLSNMIKSLGRCSASTKDAKFPFYSIRRRLEDAIQQQTVSYSEHNLHSIRFGSLLSARAIPAKVLVLLGMNESAFPREESRTPLNLLKNNPDVDFCPSGRDLDRSLFLEAILSARQYLILTYQGYGPGGKEAPASILVTELLSYCDRAYKIQNEKPTSKIVFKHPYYSFDSRYFSRDELFQSYSTKSFQAAKAYYHAIKKPSHRFVDEFVIRTSLAPSKRNFDVKELIQIARNPIRTYFQHQLGLYIEDEEKRNIQNEEAFLLSHLEKFKLRQTALKQSIDNIMHQAEKEGRLPVGAFKSVSIEKMKSELIVMQALLEKHGVKAQNFISITLSDSFSEPIYQGEQWHIPPLHMSDGSKITGTIENVCPQGIVAPLYDKDKSDIIKIWPQFLVLCAAIEEYSLPIETQLLLVREGKGEPKCAFFPSAQPYLCKYLEYSATANEHLSPLMPDWVQHFMNEDLDAIERKLQKEFSNPFQMQYDPYLHLRWAVRDEIPNLRSLIVNWKPWAEQLYADMYNNWYS